MKLKCITSLVMAALITVSQYSTVFAETIENPTNQTSVTEETKNENIEENKNVNIDINNFNNSIGAEAYVVIDSTTGEVIMGKNEEKVMYPASLTKIVTSLLLIESGKMDHMFKVSKEADAIGEASIYATEGEEISGRDLLYAMMLQSANDACYVVAEGVSGNAKDFYTLMTNRARELGAKVSNFTSSNGLHETDHVSSALDLALITKEALKYEEFREVMGAKTHTLTRTAEAGMKQITNKNRMLFENKSEYNQYAIGGKTAYTTPAGNCLIEIASKDGMEIVVVTLKSSNIYPDTNRIINYAFDNFTSTPIVSKGNFVHEYDGEFINLYTKEGAGLVAPKNEDTSNKKVKQDFKLNRLSGNIEKDEKVGEIITYVDGKEHKIVDVFALEDHEIPVKTTVKFFKNIVVLAGILIVIKIIINIYKMRKLKRKGYLKNSKFY